jgi:hypothetical protein
MHELLFLVSKASPLEKWYVSIGPPQAKVRVGFRRTSLGVGRSAVLTAYWHHMPSTKKINTYTYTKYSIGYFSFGYFGSIQNDAIVCL